MKSLNFFFLYCNNHNVHTHLHSFYLFDCVFIFAFFICWFLSLSLHHTDIVMSEYSTDIELCLCLCIHTIDRMLCCEYSTNRLHFRYGLKYCTHTYANRYYRQTHPFHKYTRTNSHARTHWHIKQSDGPTETVLANVRIYYYHCMRYTGFTTNLF